MSVFVEGDLVRANMTAQGAVDGRTYIVDDVQEQVTPFGTFTTYVLSCEDTPSTIEVRNAHMLFRLMGTAERGEWRRRHNPVSVDAEREHFLRTCSDCGEDMDDHDLRDGSTCPRDEGKCPACELGRDIKTVAIDALCLDCQRMEEGTR